MGRLEPGDGTEEVLRQMVDGDQRALEVLEAISQVTFNLGSGITPDGVIRLMDELGLYGSTISDLHQACAQNLDRLIATVLCVKHGEIQHRFLELFIRTGNSPVVLTPGTAITRIRQVPGFENFGK